LGNVELSSFRHPRQPSFSSSVSSDIWTLGVLLGPPVFAQTTGFALVPGPFADVDRPE
jgi:hypothetical protein